MSFNCQFKGVKQQWELEGSVSRWHFICSQDPVWKQNNPKKLLRNPVWKLCDNGMHSGTQETQFLFPSWRERDCCHECILCAAWPKQSCRRCPQTRGRGAWQAGSMKLGSVEKSSPAAGIELADPSRGDRRSERSGRRWVPARTWRKLFLILRLCRDAWLWPRGNRRTGGTARCSCGDGAVGMAAWWLRSAKRRKSFTARDAETSGEMFSSLIFQDNLQKS